MFCDFWSGVGLPYLHGAWHILIFLASYTAIVLFAYFEVKNHQPGETPLLRYLQCRNKINNKYKNNQMTS
jgi:alkaline ceramidase